MARRVNTGVAPSAIARGGNVLQKAKNATKGSRLRLALGLLIAVLLTLKTF